MINDLFTKGPYEYFVIHFDIYVIILRVGLN